MFKFNPFTGTLDRVGSDQSGPISAPVDPVNTFVKVLRLTSPSVMSIESGGLLRVVSGNNQFSSLVGQARIIAGSGMELMANSGLQIKVA